MTGVANRRALQVLAAELLLEAARGGRRLSVCYLDGDSFKAVNDTLGHGVGDRVLERLAQSSAEVLREGDLIGRLGGHEFAVVPSGADAEQARRLPDVSRRPSPRTSRRTSRCRR